MYHRRRTLSLIIAYPNVMHIMCCSCQPAQCHGFFSRAGLSHVHSRTSRGQGGFCWLVSAPSGAINVPHVNMSTVIDGCTYCRRLLCLLLLKRRGTGTPYYRVLNAVPYSATNAFWVSVSHSALNWFLRLGHWMTLDQTGSLQAAKPSTCCLWNIRTCLFLTEKLLLASSWFLPFERTTAS